MSATRSLVPQLEASVRAVKARRWAIILDEAAADVHTACAERDRYRHMSAPTADRKVQEALSDYFTLSEQARKELANV